jgi:hypothetical protein
MRCRVYPLRRRGRRLPWREVQNGPVFEGDLSTHYLSQANERYFVAQLLGPGDAFRKALLPELYEPVLTSLVNDVLVLRGFEREGSTRRSIGGAGVAVRDTQCKTSLTKMAGYSGFNEPCNVGAVTP